MLKKFLAASLLLLSSQSFAQDRFPTFCTNPDGSEEEIADPNGFNGGFLMYDFIHRDDNGRLIFHPMFGIRIDGKLTNEGALFSGRLWMPIEVRGGTLRFLKTPVLNPKKTSSDLAFLESFPKEDSVAQILLERITALYDGAKLVADADGVSVKIITNDTTTFCKNPGARYTRLYLSRPESLTLDDIK